AGPLTFGPVKPVAQLGSTQLAQNQLVKNPDGSLTLWFGPNPPPFPELVSNWLPTPNTAYYSKIYGDQPVSTEFQVTMRMYYPTPGVPAAAGERVDPRQRPTASILPCLVVPPCPSILHESYIPPQLRRIP